MNDDRAAVILGVAQCVFHLLDVMPIHGADVLQAQLGEHLMRNDGVLHTLLESVDDLERPVTDPAHPAEGGLTGVHDLVVDGLQAQRGQINDDDHAALLGRSNVVESLPAHAAGKGTIAHEGDHVPVHLTGQLEGLG